jgi:hypothetical protein
MAFTERTPPTTAIGSNRCNSACQPRASSS